MYCQGSNFESCVWRTVSSQSSHHSQEVLLAQLSLYVHKGGLKPDSFHFLIIRWCNSGSVAVSSSICSKYPKTYCRAVTFEVDFGRPSFLFLLVHVALSTTKKYFPFRNRLYTCDGIGLLHSRDA